MVTFLWRTEGSPEPLHSENPFSDVNPGAWYYKAVLWAVQNGITNGTGKTTFSPNAVVTRGQAVTFLWRVRDMPQAAASHPFVDLVPGQYYCDAVQWAAEKQITVGMDASHFFPSHLCTRAQIVTFLYRTYYDRR